MQINDSCRYVRKGHNLLSFTIIDSYSHFCTTREPRFKTSSGRIQPSDILSIVLVEFSRSTTTKVLGDMVRNTVVAPMLSTLGSSTTGAPWEAKTR